MRRSLCVSPLASICACVLGPQVFDGSLDVCQETIRSSHPHCDGWREEREDAGRNGGGDEIRV